MQLVALCHHSPRKQVQVGGVSDEQSFPKAGGVSGSCTAGKAESRCDVQKITVDVREAFPYDDNPYDPPVSPPPHPIHVLKS